jgi:hypothetical protein
MMEGSATPGGKALVGSEQARLRNAVHVARPSRKTRSMADDGGIKGSSSPSSTPINRFELGDELLLLLLLLLLDLVGEGGDASATG